MSFSEQTEYKNACENDWSDKCHSLHEGYAVLKEEVEEVDAYFSKSWGAW